MYPRWYVQCVAYDLDQRHSVEKFLTNFRGIFPKAVFFTPYAETLAITLALILIVAISILLGTVLPLLMKIAKIDPAHSSTTIQVIMDITVSSIFSCIKKS